MGARCVWARSKVQLWPLHFLPFPSVTNAISFASFLSPSQNSPILGLIASESHFLLVYLLIISGWMYHPGKCLGARLKRESPE